MKRIYLHSLPLRIWHWINAGVIIMLIVTGFYLRRHGIAALTPRDPVLLWHRYLGFAMIIATVFWIAHAVCSGNLRRHYGVGGKDFKGMSAQARYYLFSIFSGGRNPFTATADDKYNPLQKIAYGTVMFILLPALGVTGLLFLDIPVVRQYLLSEHLMGIVGAVHVMLSYMAVLFFVVHVYLVTLGDTVFSHTKAMIVGYEERNNGIKEDEELC